MCSGLIPWSCSAMRSSAGGCCRRLSPALRKPASRLPNPIPASTPRSGNKYVVNGQKVWISTAQVAEKILLLARTTPLEEVKSPTQGLSLFYTDFDRGRIAVHEIEKMGRKAVDSNELFFEIFEIPVRDRLGEEGRGFEYILHGMNPERILIAAEAVGLGKLALSRAAAYAKG